MSKSSFSYSAALLSTNIVYYIPFWHKTLDNWLTIDNLELWLEEFDQKYDYRKRLIYMQQFKTNKKFDQKYD